MAIVFNFLFLLQTTAFPSVYRSLFLYAQFLSRSFCSVQSVKNHLSGVKIHNLLDFEYPVTNSFPLNLLIRGLARIKQHVPNKALPIIPKRLERFPSLFKSRKYITSSSGVSSYRCFFLMTRKSNMVPIVANKLDADKQLTRNDITVREDMFVVNIKWSKHDNFVIQNPLLLCQSQILFCVQYMRIRL